MAEVWRENAGDVALIWINNPPVNAISHAVREGIMRELAAAQDDGRVRAIVLACQGRTFCAGADIAEFDAPIAPPVLPDIITAIETCPKPVVAALFGTVLGGGLELALGCHGRIAAPGTRAGLPEVTLGLIPGAGGTQRLPRLIGLEAALDLVVSGRPISAEKALSLGLVDALAAGDLLDEASAMGRARAIEGAPDEEALEPICKRKVQSRDVAAALAKARSEAAAKARGQIAPQRAIDALEAALSLTLAEGLARERAIFEELKGSNQARALRHIFFAEREALKIPGLEDKTVAREIVSAGVIGAGPMGRGIAMAFANGGVPVTVVEVTQAALDAAMAEIESTYRSSVDRGRLSKDEAAARSSRITPAIDYGALAKCDLVVEAVFEEIDVKKQVFKKLDAVAKPGAILATNTSYLDVDVIAAQTARPGDVLGTHFFSPANVMRLLEIVRGNATKPDVLAGVLKLAKRIGKQGVVSGVCHGFIGNRLLQGYIREAGLLLLEGAAPTAVDAALTDFGMAMGLLAVMDLAGLDIGYANRQSQDKSTYDARAFRLFDELVEMGRFGQKTGAGIYSYADDPRRPVPDLLVHELIETIAADEGIERREISPGEIVKRCILAIVNEGARVVAEGIAYRAGDVDVVYVNGYGFPRYRGGPMFWADAQGLGHVYDEICAFRDAHGSRWWEPAPLLAKLANSGARFNG